MTGENKLPEKITRTILRYPNLALKIQVKLKEETIATHNEFTIGDKKYINLNFNGYVTLELVKQNDQSFDMTKSFLIGMGNLGSVVKTMKKVLKNIYEQNIFALQNNKVIVYEDMAKKYTEQVTIPRIGQAIMIKPSVIYDENETSYEGVHIFINKVENVIPLSIEEFENLVYTLEKIDIFEYSQSLVNYYLAFTNHHEKNLDLFSNRKMYNSQIKKNIDWTSSSKEKTTSNFSTSKDEDIFEGL